MIFSTVRYRKCGIKLWSRRTAGRRDTLYSEKRLFFWARNQLLKNRPYYKLRNMCFLTHLISLPKFPYTHIIVSVHEKKNIIQHSLGKWLHYANAWTFIYKEHLVFLFKRCFVRSLEQGSQCIGGCWVHQLEQTPYFSSLKSFADGVGIGNVSKAAEKFATIFILLKTQVIISRSGLERGKKAMGPPGPTPKGGREEKETCLPSLWPDLAFLTKRRELEAACLPSWCCIPLAR